MRLDQARHPVTEQAPDALGAELAVEIVGPEAVADVVHQPGHLQLGVVGTGPSELESALQPVVELAQSHRLLRGVRCHRTEQVHELGERHLAPPGTRPIPPS